MFTPRPPAPPVPIVTSLVGILWSLEWGVSLPICIYFILMSPPWLNKVTIPYHTCIRSTRLYSCILQNNYKLLGIFAARKIFGVDIGDNLIGAPRESRQKGASGNKRVRVATKRRESRQKGASRDKKARVASKGRESRQKGASRDKRARVATKRRDSKEKAQLDKKASSAHMHSLLVFNCQLKTKSTFCTIK